jgi:hypothetical protein
LMYAYHSRCAIHGGGRTFLSLQTLALSPVSQTMSKDFPLHRYMLDTFVIFSIVHGIYKNRVRLFQQGRAENQLCPNQACTNETLTQSIEHIFCCCYRVRAAWQWTKQKLMELFADGRPAVVTTNMEIIMQMYPPCRKEVEVYFIPGSEAEREGALSEHSDGCFETYRLSQNRSRAVPDMLLPQNWLWL